jgi:hypothetical protein
LNELLLQSDPKAWAERKAQIEQTPLHELGPSEPVQWSSRAWSDIVEVLDAMDVIIDRFDPGQAMLQELAAEIRAGASDMDGPMPDEVKEFLSKYDRLSNRGHR